MAAIITLRDDDVIIAHKSRTFNHQGNRRLNTIILSSRDAFSAIPKNKRKQKTQFIDRIVAEVVVKGARFLVRDGAGYALASSSAAKNAVKQRLQRPPKHRHKPVTEAAPGCDDKDAGRTIRRASPRDADEDAIITQLPLDEDEAVSILARQRNGPIVDGGNDAPAILQEEPGVGAPIFKDIAGDEGGGG